jgi:FMN-dependent NADH-azoreductase
VKLLEIQSSPRGESSDSITLTKSFIEACKSDNGSIVVDTLNVWHERLPEFDYEAIGAKYKAVKHETMTEAESNVWERILSLIKRFQNADRIVLGTPMWNFSLPYKLKQLIDLVAQRNYLFTYDGKQYGPLLHVKRQSSSTHAVHVTWRVLLYRPRDSITKQPIWTFGCSL